MEKSKLKLEYKKLIRNGDLELAEAKLNEIHSIFSDSKYIKKEIKKEIINDNLDDLIKLKGIGKETLADIKRIYKNPEELKKAILTDSVPLRNNIVKKLKKYYKL